MVRTKQSSCFRFEEHQAACVSNSEPQVSKVSSKEIIVCTRFLVQPTNWSNLCIEWTESGYRNNPEKFRFSWWQQLMRLSETVSRASEPNKTGCFIKLCCTNLLDHTLALYMTMALFLAIRPLWQLFLIFVLFVTCGYLYVCTFWATLRFVKCRDAWLSFGCKLIAHAVP